MNAHAADYRDFYPHRFWSSKRPRKQCFQIVALIKILTGESESVYTFLFQRMTDTIYKTSVGKKIGLFKKNWDF